MVTLLRDHVSCDGNMVTQRRVTMPPFCAYSVKGTAMKRIAVVMALALALAAVGCGSGTLMGVPRNDSPSSIEKFETRTGKFSDDVAMLEKHGGVIVLSDAAGQAQVAVVPAFQGRVMTSTAEGPGGRSFGWINFDLLRSGQTLQHMNPYGGEDRFWMGPEGGQFSIFFAKDAPFDLKHWSTPAVIDTKPFDVTSKSRTSAAFRQSFQLTNYSGTKFDVGVRREVRLLGADEAWSKLGLAPKVGVKLVAFESVNTITNAGKEPWQKDTGLLSIWILGMFNPSPATTIVIPIKPEKEFDLSPAVPPVKDDYFGKVPAERLVIKDNTVFFCADGKYRSKIGIGPKFVKPVMGSYDAANKVLTIVQFTLPPDAKDYVNSMWKIQDQPFAGDVANSYNDGPPAPGEKPLGPFYELESSSPAAALEPGQSQEHVQRTIHLVGSETDLDAVAKKVLGVSLKDIAAALAGKAK